MRAIFAKMLYELEKKHDLMLVTIIGEQGSTPRGMGAQMLVNRQGRMIGTVGGGSCENKSIDRAIELIGEKKSEVHEYCFRKNDIEDIDSVCGGDIRVLFQYIDGTDPHWESVAKSVVSLISEKKEAWLLLYTDGKEPAIVGIDGDVIVGDADCRGLVLGRGCDLGEGVFTMKLPVGERAVLFGGGHCALALAPLLNTVGFRVTVMDCREEYANKDRFPLAEEVICGDYEHIEDYITLNENDYTVVMTSGHSFDYVVQEQLLRKKLAYVGVIGSKNKKDAVNARLLEAGISEEAIEKVHTPVGIAIKAVTPEEIAVSIAGEMILVRATHRFT